MTAAHTRPTNAVTKTDTNGINTLTSQDAREMAADALLATRDLIIEDLRVRNAMLADVVQRTAEHFADTDAPIGIAARAALSAAGIE